MLQLKAAILSEKATSVAHKRENDRLQNQMRQHLTAANEVKMQYGNVC